MFQGPYDHMTSRKLNFDGTGDVRRSPITAIPGSRQSSECCARTVCIVSSPGPVFMKLLEIWNKLNLNSNLTLNFKSCFQITPFPNFRQKWRKIMLKGINLVNIWIPLKILWKMEHLLSGANVTFFIAFWQLLGLRMTKSLKDWNSST